VGGREEDHFATCTEATFCHVITAHLTGHSLWTAIDAQFSSIPKASIVGNWTLGFCVSLTERVQAGLSWPRVRVCLQPSAAPAL
jgi:hypothetical protein